MLAATSLLFGLITSLWQTRMVLQQLALANPTSVPAASLLAPEFVQFDVTLMLALGITVYFTRANVRKLLAALAGGGLFMLLFMAEEILTPQSLHHFNWTGAPAPPLFVYSGLIPYGALIALIGWRLTRRFGWRGQVVFLVAACFGGPARDYLWTAVTPVPGIGPVRGILPWIADAAFWLSAVGLGQAMMQLIGGPDNGVRLPLPAKS